jgi:hypothetical protein
LPYPYIIQAVIELNKLQREELHNMERPVSYLAYQNAELNRDKKKRNKPFTPNEFYWYDDNQLNNLPEPRYGAAAMKLIEMGQFPSWALFVYKDLKARSKDALPPEVLCYQCEDAIILAPNVDGHEVNGMLIAGGSASNQLREMHDPVSGRSIMARMPVLPDAFQAIEESTCRLLT